jgi:hypothetical protein
VGDEITVDYGQSYWTNIVHTPHLRHRRSPFEYVYFTHLTIDQQASDFEHKLLLEQYHKINPRLADQTYQECVEIREDSYGGFGLM